MWQRSVADDLSVASPTHSAPTWVTLIHRYYQHWTINPRRNSQNTELPPVWQPPLYSCITSDYSQTNRHSSLRFCYTFDAACLSVTASIALVLVDWVVIRWVEGGIVVESLRSPRHRPTVAQTISDAASQLVKRHN